LATRPTINHKSLIPENKSQASAVKRHSSFLLQTKYMLNQETTLNALSDPGLGMRGVLAACSVVFLEEQKFQALDRQSS
jgi:hypothetical protein